MTENCSIRISLDAEYNEVNIIMLLKAGYCYQFQYRDNMWAVPHGAATILSVSEVAHRVMSITQEQIDRFEGDPSVFIMIENEGSFAMWFYKTEYDKLKIYIGSFDLDCKHKEYRVDLGYYIPLFLGLCNNFPILHVSAEFFGD